MRCSSFADARSRDDSRSWCHAGLATAPSLKGASVTTESQKAGVTTEREKASATTERQRASDSDCDSLSLPWGPKSYALGLQLVQRAARLASKELCAWARTSCAPGLYQGVLAVAWLALGSVLPGSGIAARDRLSQRALPILAVFRQIYGDILCTGTIVSGPRRGAFAVLAPALLWRLRLRKRADQDLLSTSGTHSDHRKISTPTEIRVPPALPGWI